MTKQIDVDAEIRRLSRLPDSKLEGYGTEDRKIGRLDGVWGLFDGREPYTEFLETGSREGAIEAYVLALTSDEEE